MNFEQSETQTLIRQAARDFAEKNIRPFVMEWDENQHFPRDLFKKMGDQGFMGILVPEEYGGSGLGYFEYSAVVDEIAQVCGSIGLSTAAHNSLCTGHILYFANEEQKRKYLPKLSSGEFIGAWGLTEPNTGSDAMRMKTIAKKVDGGWVLNGAKNWITHGISGDVAVVLARTGELLDSRGISAFIIDRGTPGFTGGKKENKLGMRASETAEMIFEDCFVPENALLGEEGQGFIQAMKILDGGRISIAALSLGIAKGAYRAALDYSKEREQFGKPISSFQAISFKLADMATQIEASQLLIDQSCHLKNEDLPRYQRDHALFTGYAPYVNPKYSLSIVVEHGGGGGKVAAPIARDVLLYALNGAIPSIQEYPIEKRNDINLILKNLKKEMIST